MEYPTTVKSLYVNYFFSRQDTFWQKKPCISYRFEAGYQYAGLRRGPGMVPRCVPQVMKEIRHSQPGDPADAKNPAGSFSTLLKLLTFL